MLSGEYQKKHIRLLEKQQGLPPKQLGVVGCTYLDVLAKKILSLPSDEKKEFIVLVAPTWGKSGILSKYGTELLDPLSETGYRIIIRPHPQSETSEQIVLENLKNRYRKNNRIKWDSAPENILSLSQSDVMISDFSGIIFDYVFLFDRPFLYVNKDFDLNPYDAGDIKEQPWQLEILPYIGRELEEKDFYRIASVLKKTVSDTKFGKNRKSSGETAWQYRNESGQCAVDFLIRVRQSRNDALQPPEPSLSGNGKVPFRTGP